MSGTFRARIHFLTANAGGRASGIPLGPWYYPNAVPAGARLDFFPGSDDYFSLRVLIGEPINSEWVEVEVSALVPGAPGSEALVPGAELTVMEGSQVVGTMMLDTM